MDDERIVEEIVTEFFLNTCRLRPKFSMTAVQAALRCVHTGMFWAEDDREAHSIPLKTGSIAEIYIEPMLSSIGDVDVMFYFNTDLAIPRGHPLPTQLPAEFHSYVEVHEIIDSHLPSYVYLVRRYIMTECVDDGKYNAMESDTLAVLSNDFYTGDASMHGPAIVTLSTNVL